MVEVDSKKFYITRKKDRVHAFLPEYCKCGAHRDSGWLFGFKSPEDLIILLCQNCGWEERYQEIMIVVSKQREDNSGTEKM